MALHARWERLAIKGLIMLQLATLLKGWSSDNGSKAGHLEVEEIFGHGGA